MFPGVRVGSGAQGSLGYEQHDGGNGPPLALRSAQALSHHLSYRRQGTREKIRAGYCFAIEPMLNLGTHETRTLSDKWTVVTLDGKPSAHAEHTLAVTPEGPEVLTLTKEQKAERRQKSERVAA